MEDYEETMLRNGNSECEIESIMPNTIDSGQQWDQQGTRDTQE